MKRNNSVYVCLSVALLCFFSCDFVDTSDLDVKTFPSGRNVIISGSVHQLWMDFSQTVDRKSAEETLSLSTTEGHILFDTSWAGSRVTLSPVEPWQPGIQYFFSCKGSIATPDERSFLVNVHVSFYVDTDSNPPVLQSFTPESDSIVLPTETITLHFTLPVNSLNLEKHIHITPDHDVSITASEDNRTIIISPDIPWTGLTRYEWAVAESLRGLSGTPVLEKYQGTFRTLVDLVPPEPPSISCRTIHDDNETPHDISLIKNGDGIVVTYNEAMDFESIKSGTEIDPETTLRYRQLNEMQFLIYPEDELWIAGHEYSITLKKGIEDISGNKTENDVVFSIVPDIPELHITIIENITEYTPGPNSFTEADMLIPEAIHPIAVDTLLDGSHILSITLSEQLTAAEAQRFVDSISFIPLFPHYLSKPDLLSVIFDQSTNIIMLQYINIDIPSSGLPEERTFYTFSIAGGKSGFTTDNGSVLPENLSIILETFEYEE